MKTIKVDNCKYCGTCTTIDVPDDYLVNLENIIADGDIDCFNCNDAGIITQNMIFTRTPKSMVRTRC